MTPSPVSCHNSRLGLLLWACLVFEALAPPPALAWFGWLDRWSGPGGFWGALYEVRLVCFGGQSGVTQVEAAYVRAQRSTFLAVKLQRDSQSNEFASAVQDWLEALQMLQAAQLHWKATDKVRSPVSSLSVSSKLTDLVKAAYPAAGEQPARISTTSLKDFASEADKVFADAINALAGQVIALGGTGIFWSVCSEEKERRFSIELNVNDWRGYNNENNSRFSAGTSVRLITVMPSVTWSVLPNRNWDVVDLGVAAGYYAFSSGGFESVRGFIAEPLRLELHAPTSWAAYDRADVRRLASMLTFRFGLMTVPTGFAADSFAPGSHDGPIPAELVPTYGIFFNLNSLLSNPRKKHLPPTFTSP